MDRGGFPLFTGLVEASGLIKKITRGDRIYSLSIISPEFVSRLVYGQSVSVSGACLTVSGLGKGCFEADVTSETMERTRFSSICPGERVNLERALTLSSRLDGHIVTGHVDGVAKVVKKRAEGKSEWMTFSIPMDLAKYVVHKGSVALDGISLTVAEIRENLISVALIPTTLVETTLGDISVGREVNLEVDVLGRYVERLLSISDTASRTETGLTVNRLHEMGW